MCAHLRGQRCGREARAFRRGRLEDRLEAIDGIGPLLGPEPFHRVVDRHPPGQAGEALGGGHLQDAVQVEVESHDERIELNLYIVGESLRLMQSSGQLKVSKAEERVLASYRRQIDGSTKFIPIWVKVAVAIALGLGTMVG